MEGLDSDPTLLLLTDRHLRTKTGRDLRAEVAALGRKYFEAATRFDHRMSEASELRTLCDQLTRRVQELEDERDAIYANLDVERARRKQLEADLRQRTSERDGALVDVAKLERGGE